MERRAAIAWLGGVLLAGAARGQDEPAMNHRPPRDDIDLRAWLGNMVWRHRFTNAEVRAATGLTRAAIAAAMARFAITPDTAPARPADAPLLVLPYPGGRHPRLGFRNCAVDPQRETKVSVFLPWDPRSYVVVDVPEAIFCNLGLIYLAHTHVPTIWERDGVTLEPQEWRTGDDGALTHERTLPNGIAFGARVEPTRDDVRMQLWLRNGTDAPLTDSRVQNCVMLRGARGFDQQTNDNKRFADPAAAVGDRDGKRWIITAWTPLHRTWANPPCPCVHSDPRFPDCAPGETVRIRGRLWFHEGDDIDAAMRAGGENLHPPGDTR